MRLFKLFAVLSAFLFMTAGGKAWAAEDDMQAFYDIYFQGMRDATPYHLDLTLNGPTFHGVAVMDGQAWKNGRITMKGTLGLSYTDMTTQRTSQTDIPIYLERSDELTSLYGNRNGTWQRDTLFGGLAWVLDVVTTNNQDIKAKYADTVKSVTVTNEGTNRLRLDLVIDGKKMAATKIARDRISALPEADREDAEDFIRYFNAALMKNDLPITWTVDKATGHTVTVAANLTDLMHSYAQAMLEDSYQGRYSLTKDETELLASIGYYYTLQFYLSEGGKGASLAVIPADVTNTAIDHDFLDDVKQELVSVVRR